MNRLLLSGLFLVLILFPSYAFADGPYLNIPPTNAFDKIHSDNGTVSAVNFSMPLNIKGGTGISITSQNSTHTVTITNTGSSGGTNKGTYNQTLANNSIVNSGGQGLNFINGTNSTISLVNDPSRNQINITISSIGGGSSSGVSSLNALTGALTIACVAGNTTCTTSGGNTITINTAYNIATLNLNEIFSGITTFNSAKLGGQFNLNNQNFQSLGHVYTWPNNTGTVCLTNQTGSCGPGSSATYDTMQNVGTGEGSVYKGNSTNTNFQFKTLKQGSHITLTNNTNDVTIGTTGLLSSALLSLNGDTTAAQVVASGNTNHITVTNAGANHSIDIAFKTNNQTCSAGYFVSSYSNVTGIYTCSVGNVGTLTNLSNIGHGGQGFFSSLSGSIAQLRNLTSLRTDLFTIAKNTTDVTLSSSFKSDNVSCGAGNAVTAFNNSTGTYTCSPFGSGTVTGSQNAGHGQGSVGVLATASSTTIKGRNMTGTSPITVTKTNDTDITIACSTCLTSAITSLNGQSGPSVNIVRGAIGNITITNNTNSISINTGNNLAYLAKFNNFTNDNSLASGKKLGFNPSLTNYITESATGNMSFFTNSKQRMQVNSAGSIIIGNFTSTNNDNLADYINIIAGSSGPDIQIDNYGFPPSITMRGSGGSQSAPIAVTTGNNLLVINARGYDGSSFSNNQGQIIITPASNWNTTSHGTFIGFNITPIGSIAQQQAFAIENTGALRIVPISDPSSPNVNDLWKSTTNADILKYRNTAGTTTYSILSNISSVNATTGQLSGNGTGRASATQVMDGVYATITPKNTGRMTIHVTGDVANSVSGDGCNIGIRQSTSNMGANNAAVAGTILGNNIRFIAAAANQQVPFSRIYDFSGPVNTQQFFDLAFSNITGGTCTLSSVNWDLVEH